jgi:hypothetical protein
VCLCNYTCACLLSVCDFPCKLVRAYWLCVRTCACVHVSACMCMCVYSLSPTTRSGVITAIPARVRTHVYVPFRLIRLTPCLVEKIAPASSSLPCPSKLVLPLLSIPSGLSDRPSSPVLPDVWVISASCTDTHTKIHTYAKIYTHANIHMYAKIHTYAQIHTHAKTHTHAGILRLLLCLVHADQSCVLCTLTFTPFHNIAKLHHLHCTRIRFCLRCQCMQLCVQSCVCSSRNNVGIPTYLVRQRAYRIPHPFISAPMS